MPIRRTATTPDFYRLALDSFRKWYPLILPANDFSNADASSTFSAGHGPNDVNATNHSISTGETLSNGDRSSMVVEAKWTQLPSAGQQHSVPAAQIDESGNILTAEGDSGIDYVANTLIEFYCTATKAGAWKVYVDCVLAGSGASGGGEFTGVSVAKGATGAACTAYWERPRIMIAKVS